MKHVIKTEKKVSLNSDHYGNRLTIEGKSVKDVINKLLTDIYFQHWYSGNEEAVFELKEYEIGELPESASSPNPWQGKTVYFNVKTLEITPDEIKDLIKKHRGYKNMQRLWKEVEFERTRPERERILENEKIRKENDIIQLSRMMKNKDFTKIFKAAKKLHQENKPTPEVVIQYGKVVIV